MAFPTLLQAAATAGADMRFADWFTRLVPIVISTGISLYVLFSGRSREERKIQDKHMADLLLFKETQHARNEGFVASIEKLGSDMLHKHQDHEQKIDKLQQVLLDIATIKETLRNIENSLRK